MTTTTASRVEVLPSTSDVYLNGRKVGHISHPDRDRHRGPLAGSFVAYWHAPRLEDARAEFFDTVDAAAAFIVACSEEAGR